MLKTLVLPVVGTLLLLHYLVQARTLPLPHKHLQNIFELAQTCKKQPAAQVDGSPSDCRRAEESIE